jgi:hypothetical protein
MAARNPASPLQSRHSHARALSRSLLNDECLHIRVMHHKLMHHTVYLASTDQEGQLMLCGGNSTDLPPRTPHGACCRMA